MVIRNLFPQIDAFFVRFLLEIHLFQFHHWNGMPVMLNAIINGTFGLILVFIVCEIGQRMNDAFDEIGSTINQFDWYLFPIEEQRMCLMIITIAQQPVAVGCFGSIKCTREVFKNVGHHKTSCVACYPIPFDMFHVSFPFRLSIVHILILRCFVD